MKRHFDVNNLIRIIKKKEFRYKKEKEELDYNFIDLAISLTSSMYFSSSSSLPLS